MEVNRTLAGISKALLIVSGIGSFIIAGASLYTTITGNVIGNAGDKPITFFLLALVLGIISSYMFIRVRKK